MTDGLERSCDGDWLQTAPPAAGVERIEALLHGRAYAPHRHDTYAIGYTIAGVQTFDYRGAVRHSLPGRVFVLHPDELHDGRAGTDAAFRYRMLYVEPALVRDALGGQGLPFVGAAVSADPRLRAAVHGALADFDDAVEDLRRDEILLSVATALAAVAGRRRRTPSTIDVPAMARVRDYILAHMGEGVTYDRLQAVGAMDRWTLARQFRAAYGTSPYRFLVMRRVDRARALIGAGMGLAEAALAAGFADQSHMTRQFKHAYGMPPGRWASLTAAVPR